MSVPPDPNAVYRAYDADMALLYVGISRNLPHRMRQHARETPWWQEVNAMSATWYRNRRDGLDAETLAIEDEQPLHNERCAKRPTTVPVPLPFKPQRERFVMAIPIEAEWDAAMEVARMLGRKWPSAADVRRARLIVGVAAPHILAAERQVTERRVVA